MRSNDAIKILLFKLRTVWEQELLSRALLLTGELSNKFLRKKSFSLMQSVYQDITSGLFFAVIKFYNNFHVTGLTP